VTGAASVVRYCNLSTSRVSASHCWLSRRLKAITLCLLAFRLWPARGCAQGRGLRSSAGSLEEHRARTVALRRVCRPRSPVPKGKKAGGDAPDRKVIMSGTLEHLDPTTLVIGDNVRDTVVLEPQFIASIGEHGVLQPVTAVRTDDGVEVRDGQRRTMAARDAACRPAGGRHARCERCRDRLAPTTTRSPTTGMRFRRLRRDIWLRSPICSDWRHPKYQGHVFSRSVAPLGAT
jgi:hypothetical protein